MNKRKNSDESVIFEHAEWLKTGKNPGPDSALVSSSKRGRRDAGKWRAYGCPSWMAFELCLGASSLQDWAYNFGPEHSFQSPSIEPHGKPERVPQTIHCTSGDIA